MRTESMTERLDAAVAILQSHDQGHLTDGLESVGTSEVQAFIEQVESIDFEELQTLVAKGATDGGIPEALEPASVLGIPRTKRHSVPPVSS